MNSSRNTVEIKPRYWKIKKFLDMFVDKRMSHFSIQIVVHENLFIKFWFLEGLFIYLGPESAKKYPLKNCIFIAAFAS